MIYNWKNKYGTIKTSTGEVTTNDEILKLKKELNDIKIENRIKFIEFNKDKYDVKKLCKILKVTRPGYYYNINHKTNIYKENNEKLDIEIKKIYNDSKGRYGFSKITKILKNEGKKVSQKRVARRMKFLGLKSITI